MANQDEEQPFTPSLTAARLPSVDHMFNQGGRDGIPRQGGVRTSPYIRAVDHMENVISALARGMSSRARLQALGSAEMRRGSPPSSTKT